MENLPKGTLSEKREGAADITLIPTDAMIKIADPALTVEPGVSTDPPAAPAPTIVKEPIEIDLNPKPKQEKEPCRLCKVKAIANVAFSFSLVLLVLAFSFSLVKTDK
ncbi:MAG: hypothetical protein JKY03_12555 [Aureispira sp.]|nr:hypothetical protein [Aureispira sp.]